MVPLADNIDTVTTWLFRYLVVPVLLGVGVFLTLRLAVVQVRRFGDALRTIIPRTSPGALGVLTPFQAFMTALGASIGTGNIAGVASAIISGGPGALFWMGGSNGTAQGGLYNNWVAGAPSNNGAATDSPGASCTTET